MASILTSIKKLLGIAEEYTQFDTDVTTHINSTFSILSQLGAGPTNGFSIVNKTEEWINFMSACPKLELVKSYMFLKVKMLFDPPLSSVVMESTKHLIQELEFRILVEPNPT